MQSQRPGDEGLCGSSGEGVGISQVDICGRCRRGSSAEPWAGPAKRKPLLYPRVNGWSWPLHPFQVVAWAVLLTLATITFGVFIPLLPGIWKDVAYGMAGGLFFFHAVCHIAVLSIDPADHNVRLKKYHQPVPAFDRSKHSHVIEQQFCHLCEVTVSPKAKHCRACNKCIYDFDHHCKWLNTCVGSRNYWWFIISVASAVAGLLCLMVVTLYILGQFVADNQQLRTDPHFEGVRDPNTWLFFLPFSPVRADVVVFLLLVAAVLLLDAVSLVLLVKLLNFHLYLIMQSMRTYEYFTQQQKRTKSTQEKGRSMQMEEGSPQQVVGSSSSSEHSREKSQGLVSSHQPPSLWSTRRIHPDSASLLQKSGIQQQESGSVDGRGAKQEHSAPGGESPVAKCSPQLGPFHVEASPPPLMETPPRDSAPEGPLLPSSPTSSSPTPSATKLWGTLQGGQKPQSSGSNAAANEPEDQGSQELCSLQQGQLPQPREGYVAVDGDVPSSQAVTDPPTAQGEVRIDLSALLGQDDSSPLSETLLYAVSILMGDD